MKALVAGTVPWRGKVTALLAAGLVPNFALEKTNFSIGLLKRGTQYIAPFKKAPGPYTVWGITGPIAW
jgi:hypothetical protein